MSVVLVLLLGLIGVFFWAASVKRWPFRPCRRCSGRGTNKGSNAKRWGVCPKCRGSKQVQRFGARAVHASWWSVLGSGLHERKKAQVKKAREKSGYPEL